MTHNKKQLPLFIDPTMLPTGKWHISYSEIADWMECGWRHKLKHIDKLGTFTGSIHTEFGSTIHDTLEDLVLGKITITEEVVVSAQTRFREQCERLNREAAAMTPPGEPIKEKDVEDFASQMPDMLGQVPKFLEDTFPGWVGFAGEMNLFEKIDGQTNKHLKGFIDAVIQVPRKVRKATVSKAPSKRSVMRLSDLKGGEIEPLAEGEEDESEKEVKVSPLGEKYDYWIVDWKTSSWGWDAGRKRDYQKQLQLVLYKHFFCKMFNLNLDRVKCGFVLLKRTPRKGGPRCELVKVSVGPVAQAKAINTMHTMLNSICSGRVMKNRQSCRFCEFKNTINCK